MAYGVMADHAVAESETWLLAVQLYQIAYVQ